MKKTGTHSKAQESAAGLQHPDSPRTVSYTHLDVYKRQEDMREALRMQLVVYFGVPFVLAVLNAVFIVAGVFVDAGELGLWSILRPGLLTALMVILVYGLYFVVTYAGSKRILMQNHSISAENL